MIVKIIDGKITKRINKDNIISVNVIENSKYIIVEYLNTSTGLSAELAIKTESYEEALKMRDLLTISNAINVDLDDIYIEDDKICIYNDEYSRLIKLERDKVTIEETSDGYIALQYNNGSIIDEFLLIPEDSLYKDILINQLTYDIVYFVKDGNLTIDGDIVTLIDRDNYTFAKSSIEKSTMNTERIGDNIHLTFSLINDIKIYLIFNIDNEDLYYDILTDYFYLVDKEDIMTEISFSPINDNIDEVIRLYNQNESYIPSGYELFKHSDIDKVVNTDSNHLYVELKDSSDRYLFACGTIDIFDLKKHFEYDYIPNFTLDMLSFHYCNDNKSRYLSIKHDENVYKTYYMNRYTCEKVLKEDVYIELKYDKLDLTTLISTENLDLEELEKIDLLFNKDYIFDVKYKNIEYDSVKNRIIVYSDGDRDDSHLLFDFDLTKVSNISIIDNEKISLTYDEETIYLIPSNVLELKDIKSMFEMKDKTYTQYDVHIDGDKFYIFDNEYLFSDIYTMEIKKNDRWTLRVNNEFYIVFDSYYYLLKFIENIKD